jgi:rifampicin phosphotransferase
VAVRRQQVELGVEYLMRLDRLSRSEAEMAGMKAATLGELARSGFEVPEGFVLTTAAFDRFLSANDLGPESAREDVMGAPLPHDIARELLAAANRLGDVPLAVRSSGVAEDQPDRSFAGQYDTILNVRGREELLDAVRRCWASAFGDRVLAYRRTHGLEGGRMAVLVQRMVPAESAGIAFTANPVTGDRAEVVVSAVRGLGDRAVSGEATPDECIVRNGSAECSSAPEGVLDADRARAVADLARRVEAFFGKPQDIEWATAGGQLYVLQARPITALPDEPDEPIKPIPVPVDPPPGFWQREATHSPKPLSPMNYSVLKPPQNSAVRRALGEFGLLLETIEFRNIGGWEYIRNVPLGGKDRPPPPSWLVPLMASLYPPMRKRVQRCVHAIRTDLHGRSIGRWYGEWRPDLENRILEIREVELTTQSDEDLDRHISGTLNLVGHALYIHFVLHVAISVPIADLAFTCRELLAWDDGRALLLVSGLSEMSTQPARRLSELAGMAAGRPDVLGELERVDEGTLDRIAQFDPDFASALHSYQRQFGCRALRYEIADPTLAETPELILRQIRDHALHGRDPAAQLAAMDRQRQTTIGEARRLLVNRPAAERERFERALARAERAYPVREDNEFYTVSVPLALVRYAALEMGRRLADRKQIAHRDDVFLLEMDEALTALRHGGDQRLLVRRRKGERAWITSHPGPASFGKDLGPPPSFNAFPSEVQVSMRALLWTVDHIMEAKMGARRQEVTAGALRGIAAAPGRYVGPVRIVMDEDEFGKIRAGDVLVCPITSPVWSVLFPSVGALVTDTGGILSHPAIIAREYHIPAVVATGNATSLLRDGQVVTVDGTAGIVEVQS